MTAGPCAACKFLRRKCTPECVFAPYFPSSEPYKFAYVHRIFGASNVGKILNELPVCQRKDAADSLWYEAAARVEDPVNGCCKHINELDQLLSKLQRDLTNAKTELASYMGATGGLPSFSVPRNPSTRFANTGNNSTMPTSGTQQGRQLAIREHNQQMQPQTHQFPMLDRGRITSVSQDRGNQVLDTQRIASMSQDLRNQVSDTQRITSVYQDRGNQVSDTQRITSMYQDRGSQAGIQRFVRNNNSGMVTVTGFNQTDVNRGNGSGPPQLTLGNLNELYQNHRSNHNQSQQMIQQTRLMLQPPVLQEQPEAQFMMPSILRQRPETETETKPRILVEDQTQQEQQERRGSGESSRC